MAPSPSRTSAELVFILSYCVVCECSFPLNSMAIFSSLLTKNSWVRLLFMESSLAPLGSLVTRWLCLFIPSLFTKNAISDRHQNYSMKNCKKCKSWFSFFLWNFRHINAWINGTISKWKLLIQYRQLNCLTDQFFEGSGIGE